MAISTSALLSDIAEDISDYGEWDEGTGSFLERCLKKAIDHFGQKYPWPWLIEQASLATAAGNLGPYSAPTDFDGFVPQKKLHKAYSYDRYSVPPSIGDGDNGQRFSMYRNEADGGLYFYADPGEGTRTLTYLRKATLSDLANWPDEQWIKTILGNFASFFSLHPTEDFKEQAKSFWDLGEKLADDAWRKIRRGQSRPDSRTPLDASGNPQWYALSGDSR